MEIDRRHDFLHWNGALFLGSRLKRLAATLQADAAAILQDQEIGLQPGEFLMLVMVDELGPMTVGEAATALGVSQPAVTRTALSLRASGMLADAEGNGDLRRKPLATTPAGVELVASARATIFPRVIEIMNDLCRDLEGPFAIQIGTIESRLRDKSYLARFRSGTDFPDPTNQSL